MGSIHPMCIHEGSESLLGGSQEAQEIMLGWLTQLMIKANDNNPNRALKQFQKMKPPVFEGEADPLDAEGWLLQIEFFLNVMNCTEEKKVSFSSFMFRKEVKH